MTIISLSLFTLLGLAFSSEKISQKSKKVLFGLRSAATVIGGI